MLGSPAGLGGTNARGFWPLGPAQIPPTSSFTADGFAKCGIYSLFPGGPTFGSTLYSHARTNHIQQTSSSPFYYKDSLFPTGGYTFGAPTPPPGSPYSPVSVTQLELLTKGFNPNFVIQQPEPSIDASILKKKCCAEKCAQNVCNCLTITDTSNGKVLGKSVSVSGCSRTNPLDWTNVNIKKEPGVAATCHLVDVNTNTSVPSVVKLELTSPNNLCEVQQNVNSSTTEPSMVTRARDYTTENNTSLHCTDDRTTLAGWQMGGHNSSLATPTLWQYSTPVPLEPMVPLPVSMSPVGFQLVRDPTTGGLLFLPTTGIEPLQQAVVWPSYHQSPSVILPPLPPPPLQLLSSSSSEYLSNNTTVHQHTQTQSTRLVAVAASDNKRKIPLPIPTTLIKIETDSASVSQGRSFQSINTLASNTAAIFTDTSITPLLTTHVIYQHPSSIILSQAAAQSETTCRSQATSPVTCLTPPPEIVPVEDESLGVQDAGNQTENLVPSEEETSNIETKKQDLEIEPEVTQKIEIEVQTEEIQSLKPDISGLELLSNSIVEYENNCDNNNKLSLEKTPIEDKKFLNSTIINDNLGGLDLLCALAEQRILEENDEIPQIQKTENKLEDSVYEKRKLKKHLLKQEPKQKKNKKDLLHLDCAKISRSYKTPESKEEVKKFIASKSQVNSGEEWPQMDEMELDMRMKLADLQRQYREKQRELSRLKPRKLDCLKKKHRKKSIHLNENVKIIEEPNLVQEEILASQPEKPLQCFPQDITEIQEKKSSKKRKVGRPKKLLYSLSGYHEATETIVAKKPKSNIVGYFLAAKEKFQLQRKIYCSSPPKYSDDFIDFQTVNDNNNCIDVSSSKDHKMHLEVVEEVAEIKPTEELQVLEKQPLINKDLEDTRCILTTELLEVDKLRVLTAMGGLFYAGHLNAVEPPDVYSITLDGERGNRPHIMSREEILRDAIVEVAPENASELTIGTRLCAYWSQQYRCLYPGTVAEFGSPDDPELDSRFVYVEFDDGDNGKIAIQDIRLLPSDYPIIEYDPNPLLSLKKRRRRISSVCVEDRSLPPPLPSPVVEMPIFQEQSENNHEVSNKLEQLQNYKERKRLKKKKREKLRQKLLGVDKKKKKKKKHKCVDSACKHKKHHKKHKKRKHLSSFDVVDRPPQIDKEVAVESQNGEFEEPEEPDDEASIGDVFEDIKKSNKIRDRQESCESRSKMSAFLPARKLWNWSGKGYKRPRGKGRFRKQFYRTIQRGNEIITVGDSAVFLSTGRPDRPYIGKIQAMWESCGTMVVRVKWFYHPEETIGCPLDLQYPGALFESPHIDENDVQTISHKCDVVSLCDYKDRLGNDPQRYATIYDNNDIYYLAGHYDPTTTSLKMEPNIPLAKSNTM